METQGEQASRHPLRTRRNAVAVAFCVVFLGVQIAVPAVQLYAPRPARFGWHMWSARKDVPRFVVIMTDGTRERADLAAYVAVGRGEMDLTEALPPHLCRVHSEVIAVEITAPGAEAARTYSCP